MPDRGKLAVLSIIALAVALAGFAVYWQWLHRGRAAAFWGPEASRLVQGASEAELLLLRPVESSAEKPSRDLLTLEGRTYAVSKMVDLANTPGLIHARHSLVEDASFDWGGSKTDCRPSWTHAMRFRESSRSLVIAFDFPCRRLSQVSTGRSALMVPRIADGFQRVFQRAQAAQEDGENTEKPDEDA